MRKILLTLIGTAFLGGCPEQTNNAKPPKPATATATASASAAPTATASAGGGGW